MAHIVFDSNGKWSTSLQYSSECSQRGVDTTYPTACHTIQNDGIEWDQAQSTLGGKGTSAVLGANHSGGPGGYGLRQWKGSGSNNRQTSPVRIQFEGEHWETKPQPELWIRWYHRYELGFKWNLDMNYTKELYIRSTQSGLNPDGHNAAIAGYGYGTYRVANQGNGSSSHYSNRGWNDDYPGGVSDGSWQCYEIYLSFNVVPVITGR